jgi:hypothetical protein
MQHLPKDILTAQALKRLEPVTAAQQIVVVEQTRKASSDSLCKKSASSGVLS